MVSPQAGDCKKMERAVIQHFHWNHEPLSSDTESVQGIDSDVEMHEIVIERSLTGKPLNQPIRLVLPKPRSLSAEAVQEYIIQTFTGKQQSLMFFTFQNQGLIALAKYLFRHGSQSTHTLLLYAYAMSRFTEWSNKQPDQMISECLTSEGLPRLEKQQEYVQLIDEYVSYLQAKRLAPMSISNYVKGVKTFFRANSIHLNLPYRLMRRVRYRDRSPTPEELTAIIDVADIREKLIVSILALSGIRVGTLCKLKYGHVRRDLEAGIVPVHMYIEAEITKGKYNDYDTFIGEEAVQHLKSYLQLRRNGTPRGGIAPETITDESPLIRTKSSDKVKPLTPSSVHQIIHNLYLKASILKPEKSQHYELRVHSLRKYFRTQMAALGVPTDYIEYMMGHTVSTYHDVRMKGIEFLRGIYLSSGLSIKPKTKQNKLDMLKTIVRAWGMDPEKILVKEAFTEPHRFIKPDEMYQLQITTLNRTIREIITQEIAETQAPKTGINSALEH